jgi:hypothetical protein
MHSICKECGDKFYINKEDQLAIEKGVIKTPDICYDCQDEEDFDDLDLTTTNSGL